MLPNPHWSFHPVPGSPRLAPAKLWTPGHTWLTEHPRPVTRCAINPTSLTVLHALPEVHRLPIPVADPVLSPGWHARLLT